jgi:hypothetical protein
VAKIERADKSVSMELLVRSLLSLGAPPEEIGKTLGARPTGEKQPTGSEAKTG